MCIYGSAIDRLNDEHGYEAEVRFFKSPSTMCEIFNKQLKYTQYIGARKSTYTLSTNAYLKNKINEGK